MAFTGGTYKLTFNGSFNGNDNLADIKPGDFNVGSRNVNTHNGGAEKRGGTQIYRAQIASTITCLGIGQMITTGGTTYDYSAWSNGKVYRNGTEILSGRDGSAYVNFCAADDKMFICNGVDSVQVDTGSAVAEIADPAADWTGTTQPKWAVLHSKGASRRLFFGGVPGKEDTLYYTALGAFETVTGSTSGTVVVDLQDDEGVTAACSKDGNLWIFGKTRTAILEDSSTTVATWGYFFASFKGGCHSMRHLLVANNSIFSMNSELDLYEVQTAQELRDYKQASLLRPFFLHRYLEVNAEESRIDQFHVAWDPKIRAVRVFFVRAGETTVDSCLPFYVDMGKWAPPHDSRENPTDSGFSAAASCSGRSGAGDERCFTGDYNGVTWELEDAAKTDNDNAYTAESLSSWLDMDLPEQEKRFSYGELHYVSKGDYQVDVRWFVDDEEQDTQSVSLEANGATLGSFTLDTDVLATIGISDGAVEFGQVGRRLRLQISNDQAGEDFLLSYMLVHFVPRGVRRV